MELTPQVGGRLTLFMKEWHIFSTDRWVLEVIQMGYVLEFIQIPPTNLGVKCIPVPSKNSNVARIRE